MSPFEYVNGPVLKALLIASESNDLAFENDSALLVMENINWEPSRELDGTQWAAVASVSPLELEHRSAVVDYIAVRCNVGYSVVDASLPALIESLQMWMKKISQKTTGGVCERPSPTFSSAEEIMSALTSPVQVQRYLAYARLSASPPDTRQCESALRAALEVEKDGMLRHLGEKALNSISN